MANALLSCISLADDQTLPLLSRLLYLLQSSFCFSVLPDFLVCFLLNFSNLLFASAFCFLFMTAFCCPQLICDSTFYFPPAFFCFLCCGSQVPNQLPSLCLSVLFYLCYFHSVFQSAFFLLSSLISFLSPDLLFSDLLHYLLLIQYCFLLLLPSWFCSLVSRLLGSQLAGWMTEFSRLAGSPYLPVLCCDAGQSEFLSPSWPINL